MYYLGLSKPETIKLLGSSEDKVIKDKNGENVSHLEVAKIVILLAMVINMTQDSCIPLFLLNHLANY